jgi:hypothetical protein
VRYGLDRRHYPRKGMLSRRVAGPWWTILFAVGAALIVLGILSMLVNQ